ncbi:olfactory receptor 14A16-like [Talpa occidentalis]|uniref:olfactory receptor 14A16-like n=1 Tax=Talpa occidentalis TaxID=50954 RepID=UPI00188E232B|nr:olfactory receptor 14A16-like [Talpa occidentalis]
MSNLTAITEFLLLGFSADPAMQAALGALLLLAYLAATCGNGLIVGLVAWDARLRAPMYFFLQHLSLVDFCFISTTVPAFALSVLAGRSAISFLGCVFQVFGIVAFASAEMGILTAMAYDRYVAICRPLHYEALLSRGTCGRMVGALYLGAGVSGTMHTAATFCWTRFVSREIHHFFCDIPQVILISETKTNLGEASVTVATAMVSTACFIYISFSYAHIFSAVLKISSLEGRSKALSTCVPHLVVVTVFLWTGALVYLKPPSAQASAQDAALSVFYTVVPPSTNPLIYSLRNRELRASLQTALAGSGGHQAGGLGRGP